MAPSSVSNETFTVQQAEYDSESSGSTHRSLRRILLNVEVLKSAKISCGDVLIAVPQDQTHGQILFAVGIAWPSLDVDATDVYMSSLLTQSANIQNGDKIRLYSSTSRDLPIGIPSPQDAKVAKVANTVSIRLISESSSSSSKSEKLQKWSSLVLREHLVGLKYVAAGQRMTIVINDVSYTFIVTGISDKEAPGGDESLGPLPGFNSLNVNDKPTLQVVNWDTMVVVQRESTKPKKPIPQPSTSSLSGYTSVGGLEKQISQIKDLIEIPLMRPDLFRHFGLKPPKGILLHGPPGTGKTHLARAIIASTGASVVVINGSELSSAYHGETESKLRDVFQDAKSKSPCIVVLDEVDALCPRREEGAGGEVEKRVVATLLTILDGMNSDGDDSRDERVVVVATTNRPNAIDPALRRPGRFDREVEIGIPDAPARLSILRVLLAQTPHNLSDAELSSFASRTHGYVGADLSAVIREAGTIAIKRSIHFPGPSSSMLLTSEDMAAGLSTVQPSAMREVFIETPQVHWSDIGGQEVVKQKLKETIEWPLLHPEAFTRLGVRPPKGVLLYGPPGCSKTLTAKALATESGINFIAVKGPELLNKYVGESERAVREIFRKARAASPSIVFFDEIDALGTSRVQSNDSSHGGVITTLLNEMDGVQELVGVTIVAATNRPDVIDSALMRPGRLDRILYVGPPDLQGRMDILRIRTSQMAVDPELSLEELARLTEGCSGAEITALCQDAALLTMKDRIDAPYVPRSAFISACQSLRRQITAEMIQFFDQWRQKSGLTSA